MKEGFVFELSRGNGVKVLRMLADSVPVVHADLDRTSGDIVEVPTLSLPHELLLKVRLIDPGGTIKRVSGENVEPVIYGLTEEPIQGILRCTNPNCVSVQPREPLTSKFRVVSKTQLRLQCEYCGRYMEYDSILAQLVK